MTRVSGPELGATTEAGARLVELAEAHAVEIGPGAAEHDRTATFPAESFAAMRDSGFLSGCVPAELGGLGVQSVHDVAVAISRLGRADGSTAIAATMHLAPPLALSRSWREAVADGDPGHIAMLEQLLGLFAADGAVVCLAFTEPVTTVLHPQTEAVPDGDGFRLTGRKGFATNSAIASVFGVSARLAIPGSDPLFAVLFLPRDTEGLTVEDTWDAMGMRASRSNDLRLDHCHVPSAMVVPVGPWGRWDRALLSFTLAGGYPLSAAFLGIAEAARELTVSMATRRRKAPRGELLATRPAVQRLVAEIEVELAAARAAVARTGACLDAYFGAVPPSQEDLGDLHLLMQQHQCSNLVVKRSASAAVDAAMTASGGAGYLASNPLSRLYRDVRAGPFMQPYSPVEAYGYVACVSLGLDPGADP